MTRMYFYYKSPHFFQENILGINEKLLKQNLCFQEGTDVTVQIVVTNRVSYI